jgi:chromosome segregation and condensation protein ScpB
LHILAVINSFEIVKDLKKINFLRRLGREKGDIVLFGSSVDFTEPFHLTHSRELLY